MTPDRRLRFALRSLAALLVAAWFVSSDVQGAIPFWVPFAILLAAEVEYLVRGVLELRRGITRRTAGQAEHGTPDEHDADLGWGDIVEELDANGDPVVRWIPPPPRPPRRRSRWMYVAGLATVLALLALAYRTDRRGSWTALSVRDRAATETRLVREADRIAGRPTRIACDDGYRYTGIGSDALGVAFPARGIAYLRPGVCRTLHDAIHGHRPVTDDTAEAVLVLAHEAVHLRGERRESVTECLALQEGVLLAQRLGWSRRAAAGLMRLRYEIDLADRGITRLDYALPAGCRDGGSLDRRPSDRSFP